MKLKPKIVIFDVDGVLVDVSKSFHQSILDTVKHFTGRKVSYREIHRWKNRPGYNDDWKLTTDWLAELGQRVAYAEVKSRFEQFYWGEDGNGNVLQERWVVPRRRLEAWSRRAELALFTGRTRRELQRTLDHFGVQRFFRRIVTADDVARPKPDPDGLLRILGEREPSSAVYLGDNIDDAQAAKACGVMFLGVLSRHSTARRHRVRGLRKLGARLILDNVSDLGKIWG